MSSFRDPLGVPQRPIVYGVTASRWIGSSTKIVYFLGLPRPASSGSTYMIDRSPRIARGRTETRTKLVGISAEAAALARARRLVADRELERARDQAANPAPLVPVRQRDSPRVEVDAIAAHQVLLARLKPDRMLEERLGGGARHDVRPALASTPQEFVAEHRGARRSRGRQTVGRAEPGPVGAHARLHSSARHPQLSLEDVEHAVQRGQ